jgi:hypothetical protein
MWNVFSYFWRSKSSLKQEKFRKLHDEEICDLYGLNIVRMVNQGDAVGWAYVVRLGYTECPVASSQYFRIFCWSHSQSETLYEHGSDSQMLQRCGYLKFMHLAASKLRSCYSSLFCLLSVHAPCFSWKSRGVRTGDRSGQFCPVLLTTTTNPSVRELLIQVFRLLNLGHPVMLGVHLY